MNKKADRATRYQTRGNKKQYKHTEKQKPHNNQKFRTHTPSGKIYTYNL